MGGQIRFVKKSGSATLMRLCLTLGTPIDVPQQNYRLKYAGHNLKVSNRFKNIYKKISMSFILLNESLFLKLNKTYMQVLLPLNGSMSSMILSQWLMKSGMAIQDASERKELTHILHEFFNHQLKLVVSLRT